MPVNIEMPKLSDTMTEGTVLKWHKKVGDLVEIGDVIAEIETDKATMEMEAFDEGTLTEVRVQAGEKAAVGALLAVLDDGLASAEEKFSAPSEASLPQSPSPAAPPTPVSLPPSSSDTRHRAFASPLARKLAPEMGVDLSTITGTGAAGRITRKDVESAATASSTDANAAAALAASVRMKRTPGTEVAVAPRPILPTAQASDEIVELTTMRKVIASRLLISKTTIPHFYLHTEVDAAPLLALRKQVNSQSEQTHGNKYSLNDFILKAVINAAQVVPAVNSSFSGEHIVKFAHVGLSVAVAVEDGLVTPVIKEAETKSLLAISRAVKDFAVRAKEKKLTPDDFNGGTITVSNLGAWGVESFDAIINPPQAIIISVGAVVEKPVVRNGQVVPGMQMNLGISCDHRVVDGSIGAKFLAEVRKLLEQPALMLL